MRFAWFEFRRFRFNVTNTLFRNIVYLFCWLWKYFSYCRLNLKSVLIFFNFTNLQLIKLTIFYLLCLLNLMNLGLIWYLNRCCRSIRKLIYFRWIFFYQNLFKQVICLAKFLTNQLIITFNTIIIIAFDLILNYKFKLIIFNLDRNTKIFLFVIEIKL